MRSEAREWLSLLIRLYGANGALRIDADGTPIPSWDTTEDEPEQPCSPLPELSEKIAELNRHRKMFEGL